MQSRGLLFIGAWSRRASKLQVGLTARQLAQPLRVHQFQRGKHTDTDAPEGSNILRQRASWYRHAYRSNKRRLVLHLSLVGTLLSAYLYFLREHLEPYLPKAIQPPGTPPLDPLRFRRFDLTSRTPFSSTSSILRLSVHGPQWLKSAVNYEDTWARGLWSVEIKQPQLQIARAYTPLPPPLDGSEDEDSASRTDLRFLVRRERQGEVSGYLHRLAEGSDVEVRGPHGEFDLPHDVDEVVFLAGGTGIAPAMQVAYAMLRTRGSLDNAADTGRRRMRILWASRTREDAFGVFGTEERPGYIMEQLQAMAARGRTAGTLDLEVQCFVDEEQRFIADKALSAALAPTSKAATSSSSKKLILLSGPDGFVGYLAGPKVLRNGVETQGPLAGLLSHMELRGWAVWKL